MSEVSMLDRVRVASPCQARWEDMAGDDRARFCGQCRKHVFNFSSLTRAEVEALIREKEGRLCGRYYQRADGRVLTADCPSQARRFQSRVRRFGGTLIAALLFLIGARTTVRSQSTNHPGTNRMLMGDIAFTNAPATNLPPATLGRIATPRQFLGYVSIAVPLTVVKTNSPTDPPAQK